MKVREAIRMIEQDGCRHARQGAALMRYAVVIEKAERNYRPMCPTCVATGDTVADVEEEIRSAI
jgi:hypothetical protein